MPGMYFSEEPTESDAGVIQAWEFCSINENTCCIEVVYKDEEYQEEALTKVHFNVGLRVRVFHRFTQC